jgi:hypothetical protein
MISLNQDDTIFNKPEFKVCVTGDYGDTDLVLVYTNDINNPVAQYQAYYVKYGVDYPAEPYLVCNYKLTNSQENPVHIDYDVYGFHKQRNIVAGELILVNYYRSYDQISEMYNDLILKEYREYSRDVNGMVKYRTQTTEWIMTDESIGLTNTTIKYYTQKEAIQEGIDRRSNLIDDAKVYCVNNLGLNYSFDLLNSVATYVNLFKEGYTQPLRDSISASTKGYLTIQMKEDIVGILTF